MSNPPGLRGQLVHRVRLDYINTKLAMRRGGKRQNQLSIIIHQEEVGVRGPFILSSLGKDVG